MSCFVTIVALLLQIILRLNTVGDIWDTRPELNKIHTKGLVIFRLFKVETLHVISWTMTSFIMVINSESERRPVKVTASFISPFIEIQQGVGPLTLHLKKRNICDLWPYCRLRMGWCYSTHLGVPLSQPSSTPASLWPNAWHIKRRAHCTITA